MENQVVQELNKVLGTTFVLYLQAHNFHWNVTGRRFYGFHMMYEEMYNDLFKATDDIAERIRQLGAFAPGTYVKLAEFSTITPVDNIPSEQEMMVIITENYRNIIKTLHTAIEIADKAGDSVTVDLLSSREAVHAKMLWMLEASQVNA